MGPYLVLEMISTKFQWVDQSQGGSHFNVRIVVGFVHTASHCTQNHVCMGCALMWTLSTSTHAHYQGDVHTKQLITTPSPLRMCIPKPSKRPPSIRWKCCFVTWHWPTAELDSAIPCLATPFLQFDPQSVPGQRITCLSSNDPIVCIYIPAHRPCGPGVADQQACWAQFAARHFGCSVPWTVMRLQGQPSKWYKQHTWSVCLHLSMRAWVWAASSARKEFFSISAHSWRAATGLPRSASTVHSSFR